MRRSRRHFLAIALLCAAAACQRSAAPLPADVVLIVIDTQRAENMSLYGYARDTSPEISRFAQDAVTYENAIAPGTWTVPTHAAIFTGRWPSYHGAERIGGATLRARPINPEIPTLAEIVGARGYATAAFIANRTYMSPSFGFARGFDVFVNDIEFPIAEKITAAIRGWLPERTGPIFLFANYLDPHEPYEPPRPFDTRFPGKDAQYGPMLSPRISAGETFTSAMRSHFLSQYDGETAYADRWVIQSIEALREEGRYESALIIITSDHGEMLGEHNLAGHGLEPYEQQLHVPLIVKYPGNRNAGTRVAERVSTLAVFATILEALRIEPPEGTQAVPLGQPHDAFAEDIDAFGRRVRVGYDGTQKLVSLIPLVGPERTSLYNLADDPGEEAPRTDGSGAASLRASLARFAAAPRPVNAAEAPAIDPEQEARLRALGYVR